MHNKQPLGQRRSSLLQNAICKRFYFEWNNLPVKLSEYLQWKKAAQFSITWNQSDQNFLKKLWWIKYVELSKLDWNIEKQELFVWSTYKILLLFLWFFQSNRSEEEFRKRNMLRQQTSFQAFSSKKIRQELKKQLYHRRRKSASHKQHFEKLKKYLIC